MNHTFQLIGLPDEAYAFLVDLDKVGELDFVDLLHGAGYACNIYSDVDGTRYVEYEQSRPWFSGPLLFLGLKNEKTGEIIFSWKQEEIDDYV